MLSESDAGLCHSHPDTFADEYLGRSRHITYTTCNSDVKTRDVSSTDLYIARV